MKKKLLVLSMIIALNCAFITGCGTSDSAKTTINENIDSTNVNQTENSVTETKNDVSKTEEIVISDATDSVPQIEESIVSDTTDSALQTEEIAVSVATDSTSQTEEIVISDTTDSTPQTEENVVSDATDSISQTEEYDIFEGEGDEAWEDGTKGTDFYDVQTGVFRLYNYPSNEFLIELKLPESFTMSYADTDGSSYTIYDENYNIISVFGTAGSFAQQYISEGIIPVYYDEKSDDYVQYADYRCEKSDFPIAGHKSMLVSESYYDSDDYMFKYNYFWIPYSDNEGNTQYIQFTISDGLMKDENIKKLEDILTEMLDF